MRVSCSGGGRSKEEAVEMEQLCGDATWPALQANCTLSQPVVWRSIAVQGSPDMPPPWQASQGLLILSSTYLCEGLI